jgi:hypothetical protein
MKRSFVFFLTLLACGGNPNTLFVSKYDRNRIDVLITRAKIEEDRNNLTKAEEYALQAYTRNPNNQISARLLASIYIGQAQLSLLDIAGRISTDLKTSTGSSKNTQALDVLGVLQDVVGISDADFEKLGSKNVSKELFKDLDVINPFKPGSFTDTSSPRYKITALKLLNKSIFLLCPFIPASATSGSQDSRHKCTKNTNSTVEGKAQVLFAFAMSHLLEAIYFNAVIQYSNKLQSSSSSTEVTQNSNLFKRVRVLETTTFEASFVQKYEKAIPELLENLQTIFDLDPTSMLTATMVDLRVTAQSIAAIDGFPTSMIEKIQGVITTIDAAVAKAGKAQNDLTNQTDQLRKQLSSSILSKLNTTAGPLIDKIEKNNGDISTICDSIKKIPGITVPDVCNK